MGRQRQPALADAIPETEQLARQYNSARFEFVTAELELGITFCEIAMSTNDGEKAERNALHAAEAHRSAARFLKETKVSRPMRQTLQRKIERLEELLNQLRER